jgi:uncharacterized protein
MSAEPSKLSSRSKAARAWRIARPLLLAYLVIVLGMMFLETWLVYPIPPLSWGDWNPTGLEYEEVRFTSADGTKLHGWFFAHPNPKHAILYCHGNGEDVASAGEFAAYLRGELRASVFIFDYRGYGHSEGRPYEAGCIADGCAAQAWLAKRMSITPQDIVVMGRSLGSAVAVAVATEYGGSALILECAFPSMPDIAALQYAWLPVRWIMKNQYDNLDRIRRYNGPLYQSHGAIDSLIPISLARVVFDAAPSTNKRWLVLPNCDHNDSPPQSYYRELAAFLDASNSPLSQNVARAQLKSP